MGCLLGLGGLSPPSGVVLGLGSRRRSAARPAGSGAANSSPQFGHDRCRFAIGRPCAASASEGCWRWCRRSRPAARRPGRPGVPRRPRPARPGPQGAGLRRLGAWARSSAGGAWRPWRSPRRRELVGRVDVVDSSESSATKSLAVLATPRTTAGAVGGLLGQAEVPEQDAVEDLALADAAAGRLGELLVGAAELAADRPAEPLAGSPRACTPCRRAGPRPPAGGSRRRSARRSRGRGGARRVADLVGPVLLVGPGDDLQALGALGGHLGDRAGADALAVGSSIVPVATPRIRRRPSGRVVYLVTSQKTSKSRSTSNDGSASHTPGVGSRRLSA
jgi:hypothetical protein